MRSHRHSVTRRGVGRCNEPDLLFIETWQTRGEHPVLRPGSSQYWVTTRSLGQPARSNVVTGLYNLSICRVLQCSLKFYVDIRTLQYFTYLLTDRGPSIEITQSISRVNSFFISEWLQDRFLKRDGLNIISSIMWYCDQYPPVSSSSLTTDKLSTWQMLMIPLTPSPAQPRPGSELTIIMSLGRI